MRINYALLLIKLINIFFCSICGGAIQPNNNIVVEILRDNYFKINWQKIAVNMLIIRSRRPDGF